MFISEDDFKPTGEPIAEISKENCSPGPFSAGLVQIPELGEGHFWCIKTDARSRRSVVAILGKVDSHNDFNGEIEGNLKIMFDALRINGETGFTPAELMESYQQDHNPNRRLWREVGKLGLVFLATVGLVNFGIQIYQHFSNT